MTISTGEIISGSEDGMVPRDNGSRVPRQPPCLRKHIQTDGRGDGVLFQAFEPFREDRRQAGAR